MDLDTPVTAAAGGKCDAAEALLGELGGEDADDAAVGARVKQRLRKAPQRSVPYCPQMCVLGSVAFAASEWVRPRMVGQSMIVLVAASRCSIA